MSLGADRPPAASATACGGALSASATPPDGPAARERTLTAQRRGNPATRHLLTHGNESATSSSGERFATASVSWVLRSYCAVRSPLPVFHVKPRLATSAGAPPEVQCQARCARPACDDRSLVSRETPTERGASPPSGPAPGSRPDRGSRTTWVLHDHRAKHPPPCQTDHTNPARARPGRAGPGRAALRNPGTLPPRE